MGVTTTQRDGGDGSGKYKIHLALPLIRFSLHAVSLSAAGCRLGMRTYGHGGCLGGLRPELQPG
jgi:hypothetical protein